MKPIDGGIEALDPLHDVDEIGFTGTIALFGDYEDDSAAARRTLLQHDEGLAQCIQHVRVVAFLAQHPEGVHHFIRVVREFLVQLDVVAKGDHGRFSSVEAASSWVNRVPLPPSLSITAPELALAWTTTTKSIG